MSIIFSGRDRIYINCGTVPSMPWKYNAEIISWRPPKQLNLEYRTIMAKLRNKQTI